MHPQYPVCLNNLIYYSDLAGRTTRVAELDDEQERVAAIQGCACCWRFTLELSSWCCTIRRAAAANSSDDSDPSAGGVTAVVVSDGVSFGCRRLH